MTSKTSPASRSHSTARRRSSAGDARPRGAARREALLEAVLAIVAEVGPDAVTHRRVAETAGLPLASTTYWFESKEHLLTAALELAAERDMARLRDHTLAAAQTGADPLAAAVDAILEPTAPAAPTGSNRGSLIATFALLLEAARRPGLRAISLAWTAAYLDALEPLMRAAGCAHPRQDAELLLGAADGLLIEQLAADRLDDDLRPRLLRLARALTVTP